MRVFMEEKKIAIVVGGSCAFNLHMSVTSLNLRALSLLCTFSWHIQLYAACMHTKFGCFKSDNDLDYI